MSKFRKPTIAKLHEMRAGQYADFFVRLVARRAHTTRDGKPFFTCRFKDARRRVDAPIWSDGPLYEGCRDKWVVGQFFKVRGQLVPHERFGDQIDIEQIREVEEADREDGFKEADFEEEVRGDPEAAYAELEALVAGEIGDVPLRTLVLALLRGHADRVKTCPATARHFYTYPGGWIVHTLSVTKSCAWLAAKYAAMYPTLKFNRDLLLAGAALHDLGRLLELSPGPVGLPPETGRSGHLLGQHFLAFAAVHDAAREVPDLDPELRELLEHVVVSYLAKPEWGSPRLPAIPEVLILHHADDLDAKFEMFARCIERDTSDGPFTARDGVLGRELLKDRRV